MTSTGLTGVGGGGSEGIIPFCLSVWTIFNLPDKMDVFEGIPLPPPPTPQHKWSHYTVLSGRLPCFSLETEGLWCQEDIQNQVDIQPEHKGKHAA